MGGLAGGDALCQSHADAAGLDGLFMAWLSDGTDNAITRYEAADGGYNPYFVKLNGDLVAYSTDDLVDGTIQVRPE